MARTQKLWTGPPRHAGRATVGMVVASLLTAMLMAYVLLVFHPRMVEAVTLAWSRWGGKPAWALSSVAVGSIVCAASLSLMALAAVARGVQAAPYAWSAPVVIGAAVLQAAQLETQLPIRELSVAVFATCSGLLMLVGGALLQIRGWTYKVSGSLLLTLPLMTVVAGYVLAPGGVLQALRAAPEPDRMFTLVLLLMWIATSALSLTTRAPRAGRSNSAQLERWKERAQRGEIRLAQAQRRAETAEQRLLAHAGATRIASLPTLPPPSSDASRYLAVCAGALAIALVAGYALAYRPLSARVREQRAQWLAATRAHALALEAAVDLFEAQRAELAAQLAAERSAGRAALRGAVAPPRPARLKRRSRASPAANAPAAQQPSDRAAVIDDDPIGGL